MERSDKNESLPRNKNQNIGLKNIKYTYSTTRKDLKSVFSESKNSFRPIKQSPIILVLKLSVT